MPLLEKEYRNAAKRLEDTQEELNDLHPDKCDRCPASSPAATSYVLFPPISLSPSAIDAQGQLGRIFSAV